MKPALQILCMISLLSIGTPPLAREAPEQPRHYEIEIIVFTRNLDGAGSTEYWPPLAEPPDWSGAIVPGSLYTSDTAIAKLPASAHRLSNEYRQLAATGGRLRPVVHRAWRQPLLSKDESIPVYLRSKERGQQVADPAAETFPELEGTVRVSGKRYLHVHLDLLLQRLAPPDLTSDSETEETDAAIFAPRYQAYRMIDHRRMRSDRLHYIDHPLIGVLILATPYELPQPEESAAPGSDLASAPKPMDSSGTRSGAEPASASGATRPRTRAVQP